jgi:hypothetical protein
MYSSACGYFDVFTFNNFTSEEAYPHERAKPTVQPWSVIKAMVRVKKLSSSTTV